MVKRKSVIAKQKQHRSRMGRPKSGKPIKRIIAIRIAPALLARLRKMASKQNKPYQTLIHEILEKAAGAVVLK